MLENGLSGREQRFSVGLHVISGEHGAVVTGEADKAALYEMSTCASLKIVQLSEQAAFDGETPPAITHSSEVSWRLIARKTAVIINKSLEVRELKPSR